MNAIRPRSLSGALTAVLLSTAPFAVQAETTHAQQAAKTPVASATPSLDQVGYAKNVAAAHGDKTYIILDKKTATIYLYNDDHLVLSAPALTGSSTADQIPADTYNKPLDQMTAQDNVTPAGRYTLRYNSGGPLGETLDINEVYGKNWKISLHSVYLGRPAEHRAERLASHDFQQSHISGGCINVSKVVLNKILAIVGHKPATPIYITPQNLEMTSGYLPIPHAANVLTTGSLNADLTAKQSLDFDAGMIHPTTGPAAFTPKSTLLAQQLGTEPLSLATTQLQSFAKVIRAASSHNELSNIDRVATLNFRDNLYSAYATRKDAVALDENVAWVLNHAQQIDPKIAYDFTGLNETDARVTAHSPATATPAPAAAPKPASPVAPAVPVLHYTPTVESVAIAEAAHEGLGLPNHIVVDIPNNLPKFTIPAAPAATTPAPHVTPTIAAKPADTTVAAPHASAPQSIQTQMTINILPPKPAAFPLPANLRIDALHLAPATPVAAAKTITVPAESRNIPDYRIVNGMPVLMGYKHVAVSPEHTIPTPAAQPTPIAFTSKPIQPSMTINILPPKATFPLPANMRVNVLPVAPAAATPDVKLTYDPSVATIDLASAPTDKPIITAVDSSTPDTTKQDNVQRAKVFTLVATDEAKVATLEAQVAGYEVEVAKDEAIIAGINAQKADKIAKQKAVAAPSTLKIAENEIATGIVLLGGVFAVMRGIDFFKNRNNTPPNDPGNGPIAPKRSLFRRMFYTTKPKKTGTTLKRSSYAKGAASLKGKSKKEFFDRAAEAMQDMRGTIGPDSYQHGSMARVVGEQSAMAMPRLRSVSSGPRLAPPLSDLQPKPRPHDRLTSFLKHHARKFLTNGGNPRLNKRNTAVGVATAGVIALTANSPDAAAAVTSSSNLVGHASTGTLAAMGVASFAAIKLLAASKKSARLQPAYAFERSAPEGHFLRVNLNKQPASEPDFVTRAYNNALSTLEAQALLAKDMLGKLKPTCLKSGWKGTAAEILVGGAANYATRGAIIGAATHFGVMAAVGSFAGIWAVAIPAATLLGVGAAGGALAGAATNYYRHIRDGKQNESYLKAMGRGALWGTAGSALFGGIASTVSADGVLHNMLHNLFASHQTASLPQVPTTYVPHHVPQAHVAGTSTITHAPIQPMSVADIAQAKLDISAAKDEVVKMMAGHHYHDDVMRDAAKRATDALAEAKRAGLNGSVTQWLGKTVSTFAANGVKPSLG